MQIIGNDNITRDTGEVDISALAKTEPGSLAGRYMRMYWQPIFLAEKLENGRPQPVCIMSEHYTLYRGESGAPYLVSQMCPHRQTQLSLGAIEGENIRCFYHGWMFDSNGQCVEQPAEPESFCQKISIRAYPALEKFGLIFAYLGEGEPPRFPRFPAFEAAQDFLFSEDVGRDCNFFQNLENGLDTTHLGFVHRVHPGSFDGRTDIMECRAEEADWGIEYETKRQSGAYRKTFLGMPNLFSAIVLSPKGDAEVASYQDMLLWYVPITNERHHGFTVRRFLVSNEDAPKHRAAFAATVSKWTDNRLELARAIIAGKLRLEDIDPSCVDLFNLQDDVVQMGQGATADRRHDRLGRSDAGVILIRKLWMRELKALAEQRPLNVWRGLEDTVPVHREASS
jgi:5,5'-dehydrodivanillate O-demethylase